MAIEYIIISFNHASPAPSNGYTIGYRIAGSGAAYTEFNVGGSPASFATAGYSTSYEGYVKSNCGNGQYSLEATWNIAGLTTTTTIPPLMVYYELTNCSDGSIGYSAPYPETVIFFIGDRVTGAGSTWVITSYDAYEPAGTLISISPTYLYGCPTTTTSTLAPTTTTTTAQILEVGYDSSASAACSLTTPISVSFNTDSFCTATEFYSMSFVFSSTGVYYLSYNGLVRSINVINNNSTATAASACESCANLTTTTSTQSTTTTTTVAPTTSTTTSSSVCMNITLTNNVGSPLSYSYQQCTAGGNGSVVSGSLNDNESLTDCMVSDTIFFPDGQITINGPCTTTTTTTSEIPSFFSHSVKLASEIGGVCTSGTLVVFSTEPFGNGTILYTDEACTIPVTGMNYVLYIGFNAIYNLNSTTGEVGINTGLTC